ALVMLINRTGSMVIPFLGMYMSSELNFSKTQIGLVLGCFGLGSVCGSWLGGWRSEEHTSELESRENLVCRLLLEKKKSDTITSGRNLPDSEGRFLGSGIVTPGADRGFKSMLLRI